MIGGGFDYTTCTEVQFIGTQQRDGQITDYLPDLGCYNFYETYRAFYGL